MAQFMLIKADLTGINFIPLLSTKTYTPEGLMEFAKFMSSNDGSTGYTPEIVKQLNEFAKNAVPGENFAVGKSTIVFRLADESLSKNYIENLDEPIAINQDNWLIADDRDDFVLIYAGYKIARVSPLVSPFIKLEGWYWHARCDELGIPYKLTATEPCETPEEAKAQVEEYVKKYLKNSKLSGI